MKVTVIGKETVRGTSKKTGQQLNATMVYCTYKRARAEGEACDKLWVDSNLCAGADIFIGGVYDLDRDERGYLVAFEPYAV